MDYTEIKKVIEQVYNLILNEENKGQQASYIPELSRVNGESFGIHITTIQNEEFGLGDNTGKFSIQSIAKVLSLCLAFKIMGETIWERLGVEPAGTAFNSLVQLENDKGIPRNPFINSGALVICDMLISHFRNPEEEFLNFVRDVSDNPLLDYSQKIADSEKSAGYRNVALCNFIKSFGNIRNEPSTVLDFYFKLCSLEMNCGELTRTFLFLANGGNKLSDNKSILTKSQTKRINALLLTCGFYDESGEFAFKVGLPGKSGVDGGIIAIQPNEFCISIWSPRLNEKGNSYRGLKFLELFTTNTQVSIF